MRDHAAEERPRLAGLFGGVVSDLGRVIEGELRLARAETRESLNVILAGLARVAAAAVVGLVALNVLAGAAVAGLAAAGLGAGWAALLVGVGLAGVALALALAGRGALSRGRRFPARLGARLGEGLQRDAAAVWAGISEGRDRDGE